MKGFSVRAAFPYIFILILLSASLWGRAENPFITHMYTADPSAHVWADGRLYVYPSHDVAPPQGCDLMDGYHVFSTTNMDDWIDHGQILHSSNVSWGRPEGGFMWAPDCAYFGGTYYYYFPHPSDTVWNSSWKIGVATSSQPASGFTVIGYISNIDPLIDPCVFVDDDNQVYFYHGGGNICMGGRLQSDMITVDGSLQDMTGLDDFHEAAYVFKRSNTYYLMYADNYSPNNRLKYATSGNPLGPWTYRGVILDPVNSYTSHGSIVEYQGSWWLFYHDATLSGGVGELRSICFDPVFFNPDGSIQQVVRTVTSRPFGINWPFLFSDVDYGGNLAYFHLGDHNTADLVAEGISDNSVSAVTVPDGYLLEIFDGNNQSGGSWNIYKDVSTLSSSGCNDVLSSIRISTGTNFDKYEAESGTVAGGATIGGAAVENLHIADSYFELNGIDGGAGGTRYLDIIFASQDGGSLTVWVNGVEFKNELGSLNCAATGDWSTYIGNARQQINLNPGSGNTIRIVGGSGGVNVDYIGIVTPSGGGGPSDTTAPNVWVSSGPAGTISTNEAFSVVLTADESLGYWSLDGLSWYSFYPSSGNINISATATLYYYGRDALGNTSVTNAIYYEITNTGGGTPVFYYLEAVSSGDGAYQDVFMDGRWVHVAEEESCCPSSYRPYTYFRKTNAIPAGTLYLEFMYKDVGQGAFNVHYDAVLGDFYNTDDGYHRIRNNTSNYKIAVFELEDATMDSGQFGQFDLRLASGNNDNPYHIVWARVYTDPPPLWLSNNDTSWIGPYTGQTYQGENLVDTSTMANTILVGYQGWFRTPGDDDDTGWEHYVPWGAGMDGSDIDIDYWPDMSEMLPHEKFTAPGFSHSGKQSELFSSDRARTVLRHFQWMEAYGIDGAEVQRFLGMSFNPDRDYLRVLDHVRTAANLTGRTFLVEYDLSHAYDIAMLSGLDTNMIATVSNDWAYLVDQMQLTADDRYLREGGKPVVGIFGFYAERFSAQTFHALLDIFDNPAQPQYQAFVAGAGAWYWNQGDAMFTPQWKAAIYRLGSYQPWNVGHHNGQTPATAATHYWQTDRDLLLANGVQYQAQLYPGASAFNRDNSPWVVDHQEQRRQGEYLWEQVIKAKEIGAWATFISMYDEMDEGTQIFKITADTPDQFNFRDYEGKPSDCYLCLSGLAGKIQRGELPDTTPTPDCSDYTQPSIPEPLFPIVNGGSVTGGVDFTWMDAVISMPSTNVLSHYELKVNGIIYTNVGTNLNLALADGTYLWKVRAVSTLGNPGGWSVPVRFHVSGSTNTNVPVFPPPVPVLGVTNTASFQLISGSHLFAGYASNTNTGYDPVTVYYRVDGGPCLLAGSGPGWTLAYDTSLLSNGPHQFDFIAVNLADISNSVSLYPSVYNNVDLPSQVTLLSPSNGALFSGNDILLSWSVSSDSDGIGLYEIEAGGILFSNVGVPDEITNGIRLWWRFDDGSGVTAADSSGNGFPGLCQGTPAWTTGMRGEALDFSAGDYVSAANYSQQSNSLTIAAWVRHDVLPAEIERYVTLADEKAVIRHAGDGSLHFYIKTDGALRHLQVNGVISQGVWQHVAGTWDGTWMKLYHNGFCVISNNPPGVLDMAVNGIDAGAPGESLDGQLDDIRVYERALSDAEVQTVFTGSATMVATSRVLSSLADGTYGWRVRAVDSLGAPGPWSSLWSFTLGVNTNAPYVVVSSGPQISLVTNQIFTVELTASASNGYWSTNGGAWNSFYPDSGVINISGDTILSYYGSDGIENSGTNILAYIFDLVPPLVTITAGPSGSIETNEAFFIELSTDELNGYFSFDQLLWISFDTVTNILVYSNAPGFWYYGADLLGNTSVTNSLVIVWLTNLSSLIEKPGDPRLKVRPGRIEPGLVEAVIEGIPLGETVYIFNVNGDMLDSSSFPYDGIYTASDGKEYGRMTWLVQDSSGEFPGPGIYFLRAGGIYSYFVIMR